MSMQRVFYVLEKPRAGTVEDRQAGTDFLKAYIPGTETIRTGDAPTCPQCGGHIGMLTWLPPYEGELECWGREFGDIVPKVNGQDLLISERFKVLYEEFGLTGLTGFDPVEILRVKKRYRRMHGELPKYFRVDAARSRAAVDQRRSGYVWKVPPTCDECRLARDWRRKEAIIIEPGTWSGEDIFVPRGGPLLVSARFKEFCETHQIRNAILIPSEQYWSDAYPYENKEIAYEILGQPVGDAILEKVIVGGKIMRFDRRTNHIVIYEYVESIETKKKDLLVIRGHFQPRNPMAFWNRHPSID